jgi:hypothetical protein
MRTRLPVVLLLASCSLFGADRDFDRVVAAVESRYGVKRVHVPLMGVANLFVKVARPAGASSFKLAIFENLNSAGGYGDTADLDRLFDDLSARGLRPLVRVHSRRSDESTFICTGEVGKSTKLLIATFARNQATVIECQVNIDLLMKTFASPELASKTFGMHQDSDRW